MTAEDRDPFDAVQRTSLAFQEFTRQRRDSPVLPDQEYIAALTGDDCGPPIFDLEPIWRAALDDETNTQTIGQRRYLSPRRFVNRWAARVGALDDSDGRIRVDEEAALSYCQQIDCRVMSATIECFMRRQDAAIGDDPIGAAVRATKGGGFAVMMISGSVMRMTGLTFDELREAMFERARAEAARLDDFAAESLLFQVHQAIGAAPNL